MFSSFYLLRVCTDLLSSRTCFLNIPSGRRTVSHCKAQSHSRTQFSPPAQISQLHFAQILHLFWLAAYLMFLIVPIFLNGDFATSNTQITPVSLVFKRKISQEILSIQFAYQRFHSYSMRNNFFLQNINSDLINQCFSVHAKNSNVHLTSYIFEIIYNILSIILISKWFI